MAEVSWGTLHPLLTASLAQLVEHALRKRMVAGSIPAGGLMHLELHPVCRAVIAGWVSGEPNRQGPFFVATLHH